MLSEEYKGNNYFKGRRKEDELWAGKIGVPLFDYILTSFPSLISPLLLLFRPVPALKSYKGPSEEQEWRCLGRLQSIAMGEKKIIAHGRAIDED